MTVSGEELFCWVLSKVVVGHWVPHENDLRVSDDVDEYDRHHPMIENVVVETFEPRWDLGWRFVRCLCRHFWMSWHCRRMGFLWLYHHPTVGYHLAFCGENKERPNAHPSMFSVVNGTSHLSIIEQKIRLSLVKGIFLERRALHNSSRGSMLWLIALGCRLKQRSLLPRFSLSVWHEELLGGSCPFSVCSAETLYIVEASWSCSCPQNLS